MHPRDAGARGNAAPHDRRDIMKRIQRALAGVAAFIACSAAQAQSPVGNGFTYQGKLTDGGAPATGQYDFTFRLYNASDAVSSIGNPVNLENVQVTGGLFTVELNFGNQFGGEARWIGVFVRPGASSGSFTTLMPRQEMTPTPYAISADSIQLPFSGAGASNAGGLFDPGLFNIVQTGSGHTIKGTTQGDGAAIRGEASGPGDGIGVLGTSRNDTAGWFEISNEANASAALFARTAGPGYSMYAQNIGAGKALGALQSGSTGEAALCRITGFGNQSAAVRAETDNSGAALYAKSQFGPALQINHGYIKVDGAGQGTTTPVFIHQVHSGNRVGENQSISVIDHPLCNNDPNAILIITPSVQFGDQIPREPVGVLYGFVAGRWSIYNMEEEQLNSGLRFNVLVIKP
jgi:hypothetical protein